ncbi:MAG: type II toxin-antitoxin system RelE/ParE family toxin [Chitinophagales bacterium]
MIKSFRHKGLRLFWEYDDKRKLPAGQLNKIMQMLELIDNAQRVPQDFEFFKSWRVHLLKGESTDFWSLTVKENWRIVFRFDEGNAFDIDYLDYH